LLLLLLLLLALNLCFCSLSCKWCSFVQRPILLGCDWL